MVIELIILLIHIIVASGYSMRIYFGRTYLRKEHLALVIFIPIFGPLVGGTIELMNILGKQGVKSIDIEPLSLGNDILWVTLKSFHENADLVPLEEAMLIDEVDVRRRFMLETLYTDPTKYLDVLNLAKYNDDVETSHYATTTISKVQKDFQIATQKLAVALENDPDNQSILDRYIETVESYMNSGLLEEHLLRNMRIVYSKALDKKLEHFGYDTATLIKKARNCVALAEYNTAFEVCDFLIATWPESEDSWIELIRTCVDSKDAIRLGEARLKMSEQKINWTREGKESVKPWLEEFLHAA